MEFQDGFPGWISRMDLYDGPEEKALLVEINVSMITLEECFHFMVIFLTLLDDASEEGQQGFLLKKRQIH